MLRRIQLVLFFIVSAIVGYTIGNGPLAEWVVDVSNLIGISWAMERVARGPSGTLPLLLAGYLLGQGTYLLARTAISRIGPLRAQRAEELAAWDPSVHLATRFGLHQYLEKCAAWAAEDPTVRMQNLALFKIRGLGALNDEKGTLVTTQLLQRIATEIRAAALPDSTPYFRRLLGHYFPRPLGRSKNKVPAPRYPARWSGATFALAFRELDALQTATIARDLASWIRHELSTLQTECKLTLSAVVAIGTVGGTGRGLAASVAAELNEGGAANSVLVLIDPADARGVAIEQMNGVDVRKKPPSPVVEDATLATASAPLDGQFVPWIRTWGPSLACIFGAIACLAVTGGKAPPPTLFAWPQTLVELQIVDAAGPKTIRLAHRTLAGRATANWRISDAFVIQSDPPSDSYKTCQIHVSITNTSGSTFYVSAFDFSAIDATGKSWDFDPQRVCRMVDGLTGRWLKPSETWAGWLWLARGAAPITGLQFRPDRHTQIEISTVEAPAPAEHPN